MVLRIIRRCLLAATLTVTTLGTVQAQPELIAPLHKGELVILIRHTATEPGLGDPPDFSLDDCSTQRNLSAQGRDQARKLGVWFEAQRIPVGEVRTSQWCRCVDTAELAFGSRHPVEPWPAINSFFQDRGSEGAATRDALASLATPVKGNRVWVTHQVNITALTGIFPAMGEMVIARPVAHGDGYRLEAVGRIKPDRMLADAQLPELAR